MSFPRRCVVQWALSLTILLSLTCSGICEEAGSLLQAIYDSRQNLEPFRVTYDYRYEVSNLVKEGTWNIWQTEQWCRGDLLSGGECRVSCLGWFGNTSSFRHFYCNTEKDRNGVEHPLSISDQRRHVEPRAEYFVPYAKWLGVLPSSQLNTAHLNAAEILLQGTKVSKVAGSEIVADTECVRVNWELPHGVAFSIWVNAKIPTQVRKVESHRNWDNYVRTVSIESFYELPGNDLYPSACKYAAREDNLLTESENIEVTCAEFGEVIEPAVFSLEGIESLRPGKLVDWDSNAMQPVACHNGVLMWDGNKIVCSADSKLLVTTQRTTIYWPTLLAVNIGILFILAGIIVWKRSRA